MVNIGLGGFQSYAYGQHGWKWLIVGGRTDESYPPLPTRVTRFWRGNLLWQAWRFIVLNLKIMRIIVGGHS